MAAKKKAATAKKPRAKKAAPPKKHKTSSAPGEAAEAHNWLMKRLEEQEDQPVADELPQEVHDVPDEDDTDCGPSEEEAAEFELAGRDKTTGQFVKGYKGGPGRKKGSRAKLATEFFDDFYNHWLEAHEEAGTNGMAAIKWVFLNKPDLYFKGAIQILPSQVDVRVSEFTELTDDALDKKLAEMTQQLGVALSILQPKGAMQ